MDTSKIIFIVGAGRSGTTWLHMMLGAHPEIATGQESQLFEKYLRKLDEQWQRELQFPENDRLRRHGVTSYVDQEKFTALMRNFALGVFAGVLAAKPGAGTFLEKSPNNSFNIDLILRCFPEAKFIHVIRDGRDVVTSVLAAGKSWGRQWAPKSAGVAAAEWQQALRESRRLEALTDRYTEVRYEDLLTDGADELTRLLEFLELPLAASEIAGIYERFAFRKLKENQYERDVFLNSGAAKASGTADLPEPKGFFRKGIAGDWKNKLSPSQLAEIYWVAGKTLSELGYEKDLPPMRRAPWSIRKREWLAQFKTGLRRFGKRLLS